MSVILIAVEKSHDQYIVHDANNGRHPCSGPQGIADVVERIFADDSIPTASTEGAASSEEDGADFAGAVAEVFAENLGRSVEEQLGSPMGDYARQATMRGSSRVLNWLKERKK